MKHVEVIKKKCCGKIIAACIYPLCKEDDDWLLQKRIYLKKGHVAITLNHGEDWKLEKCNCTEKTKKGKSKMQRGKVEKAERLAFNNFDKWNEVSGVVEEGSGYYYEILDVISDSVHIGIQMALYGKVNYGEEGEVLKE